MEEVKAPIEKIMEKERDKGISPIETLMEPFSKELLFTLLRDLATEHHNVANRIRMVAEQHPAHRNIFVYGLNCDSNEETLMNAFKVYGDIEECKAVTDEVSGKCKGFGFILFKTRTGACMALKDSNKIIDNRSTGCHLVPVDAILKPSLIIKSCMDEDVAFAAREFARMRATPVEIPIDNEGTTVLHIDFPEPVEVELGPKEYEIYEEEIRRLYNEKLDLVIQYHNNAHRFSPAALAHYNEINGTNYVLVESVKLNDAGYDGSSLLLHLNFKAKKPDEDKRDAVMFFAEIKRSMHWKPPIVVLCTILNDRIQNYCGGCAPRWMIQHPVGGFNANLQNEYKEERRSIFNYLGLLDSFHSGKIKASNA